MFPVPVTVAVVSLVEFAVIGITIGALSGLLASRILGTNRRWILLDAFLGLIGEFVGLIVIGFIFQRDPPWPLGFVVALLVAGVIPFCFERLRAPNARGRCS